jgi:hypothetical protein
MNIIIGAGISGLIWSYYYKDYCILSDQIGGQMNSHFDLGPRYLHNKSEAVTKFLDSLQIPIKIRTIRVGYIDDNGWVENPDLNFRQQYFMKSRGVKTLSGFDPTVLNTNISEFSVCDIDFRELINKLFEQVTQRLYSGRIEKIDLEEQLIVCDTGLKLKYDNLVSTIPLNIFCRVSGIKLNLEYTSMAYCLLSDNFFDLKQFDFVYDNRTTTSFHRMTKCKQGIVCDFLENKKQEFINSNLEHFALPVEQSIRVLKNSQIISFDKDFCISDKPNIKFIGRYGSWARHWKTETVIEEAQKHG